MVTHSSVALMIVLYIFFSEGFECNICCSTQPTSICNHTIHPTAFFLQRRISKQKTSSGKKTEEAIRCSRFMNFLTFIKCNAINMEKIKDFKLTIAVSENFCTRKGAYNSLHSKWIYGFWLISVLSFNLKESNGVNSFA